METNQQNENEAALLPWIRDGQYNSDEWQKKLAERLLEIRGSSKPGSIVWDMNNRTVI